MGSTRIAPLWLGAFLLLSCRTGLGDAIYFRCVQQGPAPQEVILVMLDPLLGEMDVETFLSKALRSRAVLQIEEMDEATIRGHSIGPQGDLVLELNRIARRATLTLGDNEAIYYDCDAPSSSL